MTKQMISISDISGYLYCPRKIYFKLVKKIREPPTKRMILGMLRHQVFDVFNKNEASLISDIKEESKEQEIKQLYLELINTVAKEALMLNQSLVEKFQIDSKEFLDLIEKTASPEINLRVEAVKKTLEQGFLGKELWLNLQPKYLTEFELKSPELGLKGRIDRIKFDSEILPYELKTRDSRIFDSDIIQLAGYALLLEQEFNKTIEKGVIETSGNTEEVILDKELKNQVLEIADKIRNLTEESASMPSNFKKCESCQLREVCFE